VAEPRDLGQQIDDWLGGLDLSDPGQAELERLLLRAEREIRNRSRQQDELRRSLNEMISACRLKVRQLSLCRDVTAFLASSHGSDRIFNRLPVILRSAFDAEACSLLMLDPERDCLDFVGADLADGRVDLRGRPIPLGEGVAGWVAANRRSWLSPVVEQDPHFHNQPGVPRPGSLLCAPLVLGESLIGVVNLSHSQTRRFDGEDERLLCLLADQAAVAISNARLAEDFRHRIQRKARELGDLQNFFQSIMNASDDLILVTNPERRIVLASQVAQSLLEINPDDLVGKGLDSVLNAADMSESLRESLEDLTPARDEDIPLRHRSGRSLHASLNVTPIIGEHRDFLGFLLIFRSIERRMKHQSRLTAMTNRLQVLFDSAVELSSSLEVSDVLAAVLLRVVDLLEASEARITLLSPDRQWLLPWTPGSGTDPGAALAVDESAEGIVVKRQRPLLLSSRGSIRQFLPNAPEDLSSRIMLPLQVKDQVLGVLTVDSRRPERQFDPEDQKLATTFATQASLAIENSRLYSATLTETRRLTGLLDLSRSLLPVKTAQEHFAELIRRAPDLCGALAVCGWLRGEDGRLRLVERPAGAFPLQAILEELDPEQTPDALLDSVIQRQQECRISLQDGQTPDWVPRPADTEGLSVLAVPVGDAGSMHGIVLFYWHHLDHSMPGNLSFVHLLIMQVATALKSRELLAENRASRQFLREVIAATSDAIVVSDRNGRISLFNEGACRMTGLSEELMLGHQAMELYPEPEKILAVLRRSLKRPHEHALIETDLLGAAGRRVPVQMSIGWITGEGGVITGVIGVAKDITEQRKLEHTRLEADRLKGVEQMAVTVSDQINTPLSVILAHIELLETLEGADSKKAVKGRRVISEQVLKIKQILDRLNSMKSVRVKQYGIPNVLMYDLEDKAGEGVQ
jgi:PAS domain S-box-containing protein